MKVGIKVGRVTVDTRQVVHEFAPLRANYGMELLYDFVLFR